MAFADTIKSAWPAISSHPLTISTFKGAAYGSGVGLGVGVASSIASYLTTFRVSELLVIKLPALKCLAFTLHTALGQIGDQAYALVFNNFPNPQNFDLNALDHHNEQHRQFVEDRLLAALRAADQAENDAYNDVFQDIYGAKAQAQRIATATLFGGGLGAVIGLVKGVYDNYIATPNGFKGFYTTHETQPELNQALDYSDDL